VTQAQIVVHGLPYATTWQDLKDLTKTVAAAAGREVKQVKSVSAQVTSAAGFIITKRQ